MSEFRIITGDCLESLKSLPSGSVRCCVTSPPYWGLRDYGHAGQIGLEPTPEAYVARMVEVFREVRRVLADDGTLWLNLGDSYAQTGGPGWQGKNGQRADGRFTATRDTAAMREMGRRPPAGIKPKDLVGIPWRVAFALQADGWYLRSDIIWHKPNPMPESVTDRPTKAHEYLFLLAKSERYYYDNEAVKEPNANPEWTAEALKGNWKRKTSAKVDESRNDGESISAGTPYATMNGIGRNRRSVWTVATQPFKGAHFATFPPKLIEPCILAGSAEGDTVLDPFNGAGTTGLVALRHGRRYIGIELNPAYVEMTTKRLTADAPLLNKQEAVA